MSDLSCYSNQFTLKFDEETGNILIYHPKFEWPMGTIRKETYQKMTYDEICHFLGSRFILLIPATRDFYKDTIKKVN